MCIVYQLIPPPLLSSASVDHDCLQLTGLWEQASKQAGRHTLPSLAPAHPRGKGGERTGRVHEHMSQRPLTSEPPSNLVPYRLFFFLSSPLRIWLATFRLQDLKEQIHTQEVCEWMPVRFAASSPPWCSQRVCGTKYVFL